LDKHNIGIHFQMMFCLIASNLHMKQNLVGGKPQIKMRPRASHFQPLPTEVNLQLGG